MRGIFVIVMLTLTTFLGACSSPKKVVFVSGNSIHLWGDHEHSIMCDVLVDMSNEAYGGKIRAEHLNASENSDWSTLNDADAIIVICEGENNHPFDSKTDILRELNSRGVNIGALHYSLMFNKSEDNEVLDDLIGGHYQKGFSYNPFYEASFDKIPVHAVTSGVKSFGYYDEWHFNIFFSKDPDKKLTPILKSKVPDKIRKRRSAPKEVQAELGKGKLETIAWLVENKNGTRGFGMMGGHVPWTFAQKDYRKILLNMVAWLAEIEIPQDGFEATPPSFDSIAKKIKKPKRGDYDYYIKDWRTADEKWRNEK